LASRAALRASVFLNFRTNNKKSSVYLLSVFRCLLTTQLYHSDQVNLSHLTDTWFKIAASAVYSSGSANAAAAAATAAVYFSDSAKVAEIAAHVVITDDTTLAATLAATATAAFWKALTDDANALINGTHPKKLMNMPLWRKVAPDWWLEQFETLKSSYDTQSKTIEQKTGWLVWMDWLQSRVDGTAPWGLNQTDLDEILPRIGTGDNRPDFWYRYPEVVNSEIASWLTAKGWHKTEITSPEPTVPASENLQQKNKWDFFISYSTLDEEYAIEIDEIVRGLGFTTFVQFKDFPPGSNIVRQMQIGLAGAGRVIALHSPNYENSDHCQAEWSAAYRSDPSGIHRKLLPFLIEPTELNPLAANVSYVELVGLDKNGRRKEIIKAVKTPPPLEGVESPVAYEWSNDNVLQSTPGSLIKPNVPEHRSDQDRIQRLEACKRSAQILHDDIFNGRLNDVGIKYMSILNRYLEELPSDTSIGSIFLCDGEADVLRLNIASDKASNFIGIDPEIRLMQFLKFHDGLIHYYPEIAQFKQDVGNSRISEPLPQDAVLGFTDTVNSHSQIIDKSVGQDLSKINRLNQERAALNKEQDQKQEPKSAKPTESLSSDPISDIDPIKTADFSIAAAINKFWQFFLQAPAAVKKMAEYASAYEKILPYIIVALEWLKKYIGK
jgi:hypothetical protein